MAKKIINILLYIFLHYHYHRLPIVQGATFSFLGPTIAILNLPEYKCPDASAMVNQTDPITNITKLGEFEYYPSN